MRGNSIDQLVLYEDNHILVINKPPGEIVQGDKTGDEPLSGKVKLYIKERYGKPGEVFLGVVHRIDRPVSGAVIFARTSKALSRLNRMLREGGIRKTYWAVVQNPPPREEERLVHFMTRNEKQNKSYIREQEVPGSLRAELHYRLAGKSDRYYLLEVDLMTGRHHQIRAQLAHIGCPIRGDLKYGYPRSNPDGSIHLHARRIELIHPVKETPLSVVAPVPDEKIWNYFSALNPERDEPGKP
jgi:23S rRNA pseudouridine1911/1915/1917 synthase